MASAQAKLLEWVLVESGSGLLATLLVVMLSVEVGARGLRCYLSCR